MNKIDISSEFNLNQNAFMDLYTSAKEMYKLFNAYVSAGFTEDQALKLIGYSIGAMTKGGI